MQRDIDVRRDIKDDKTKEESSLKIVFSLLGLHLEGCGVGLAEVERGGVKKTVWKKVLERVK